MKNVYLEMHELIDKIIFVRFLDVEKEREYCEKLLDLANEFHSDYAKAFAYTYLGDYYLALNDPVKSGQYLFEARQMCSNEVYPALYTKVCHLSGFLYDIMNDEQNSLYYYLQAISIAEGLQDKLQICNAWNNIANMYQRHHQLESAKKYYLNAYQAMENKEFEDKRLSLILLYNLSEVHGYLGKMDEMKRFMDICCEVETEDHTSIQQLFCDTLHFLYAGFQNKTEEAFHIAKELVAQKFYGVEDRYLFFEFLLTLSNMLVTWGNNELAYTYLEVLNTTYSKDELEFTQRYIDIKVQYAKAFGGEEEVNQCCREYYLSMRKINQKEDDVRVNGMDAKINLYKIMREHENVKEKNKRLEEEVKVDGLTGVYNRRYFNQRLSETDKISKGFGIIMIDIDYFKEYNDGYGHIHGDVVLREIGDILRQHEQDNIKPCRYGGDEFTCICTKTSEEEVLNYIHKVQEDLATLKREHKFSKCSSQITLSIGYQFVEEGRMLFADEVLNQADKALYQAKLQGRNNCKSYEL